MAEPRTLDVLAVGGIDADLVLTVDRLPSFDEKVIGRLVGRLPGGPAANSACAASRLGLRVAALATVGDDEAAQIIIDGYTAFGVDTSLIEVAPDATSPFTVILLDPTGEKAIVVVPGTPPRYRMDRVEQALRQARAMYMMPGERAQFLEITRLARACGAEVMIDVESTVGFDAESLDRLLAAVDIASFNQDGFLAATGEQPTPEALRRLLDYGPHTIVVTRGAQGALAATADRVAERPGYRVDVVDTTGAGDTFNAAFLCATFDGLALDQRLRFANAAAALSVTSIGPRGRLPTRQEIESFLQIHTEE
ncbi:MAG: carbohydrate kinase family protein [Roseiflexaceae bacterium]